MRTTWERQISQGSLDFIPLFSDTPGFGTQETPLLIAYPSRAAEQIVVVEQSVIRTYQTIIFELRLQVMRYKALLEQVSQKREAIEEIEENPTPLNAASIEFVRSLIETRIPETAILRANNEEEP